MNERIKHINKKQGGPRKPQSDEESDLKMDDSFEGQNIMQGATGLIQP